MTDKRALPRQLARESLEKGDATGWFEELYNQAAGNESVVPWADMTVNPHFAAWLASRAVASARKQALVIGCGLGDDAEALALLGFQVVAFDVSPTAIAWCRRRFPQSAVQYVIGDLLALSDDWAGRFAFVLEVYTLQVLPASLRRQACEQMARVVAADGTLLVIARGREPTDDAGSMPWPLTRAELKVFGDCGLSEVRFEDYFDHEDPPVRRFRAEYRRPAPGMPAPDVSGR
jgi:SAM-dependent methyltransferase